MYFTSWCGWDGFVPATSLDFICPCANVRRWQALSLVEPDLVGVNLKILQCRKKKAENVASASSVMLI